MNYETEQLALNIVNTESLYNMIQNYLNDFGTFKTIIYNIFVDLNNKFDLINNYNFELSEVNYNELFDYLKEYFEY